MSFPLTTTLNRVWEPLQYREGIQERALAATGKNTPDDEPITYQQIVESVGFDDALWCCRAEPQHSKLWRLYAVWCAKPVQHLLIDGSSFRALKVAEQYANGDATDGDLTAAREAVWNVIMESSWYKGDSAWESASGAARYACRRDVAEFDKYFYPFRDYQRDTFLQLVTLGTLPKVDTWKSR